MPEQSFEIRALETVDHEEHMPVDPSKRDEFHEQVAADPDIQELIRVIKQGWPDRKKCPPAVCPYYDEPSELIESHGLVFVGNSL